MGSFFLAQILRENKMLVRLIYIGRVKLSQ